MRVIKYFFILIAITSLSACQTSGVKTTDPNMPSNAYLEGKGSNVGVVLCHGRGQYPTWLVVDPLRRGINEQLGYHTLSIQMPKAKVNWRKYEAFFPEAHKRIAAAVRYLKEEKQVTTVYLMGHSMGTRMATSYIAQNPDAGIDGFIGVGIRNGGGVPLDSKANLAKINVPVLDVYGDGGDGKDAAHAQARAFLVDENYKQVLVPGANHKFTQSEEQLINVVVSWLAERS